MATSPLTEPASATGSPPVALQGRHTGDRVFKGLLTVTAWAVPILMLLLVIELWVGSRLAIDQFGLGFITGSTISANGGQYFA